MQICLTRKEILEDFKKLKHNGKHPYNLDFIEVSDEHFVIYPYFNIGLLDEPGVINTAVLKGKIIDKNNMAKMDIEVRPNNLFLVFKIILVFLMLITFIPGLSDDILIKKLFGFLFFVGIYWFIDFYSNDCAKSLMENFQKLIKVK